MRYFWTLLGMILLLVGLIIANKIVDKKRKKKTHDQEVVKDDK